MSISEPFIRRPVLTLLFSALMAVFGVTAYFQLPVSDLPDVEYPVIQVQVAYPGANPKIMAQNIASPLEKEFLKIQGIETVTSTSRQGFTQLTLEFTLDKGIDEAAPDVQSAINAAQSSLPGDLPSPPVYNKTNPNDQPILYIGLVSTTMTQGEIYDYAFNEIAQRINVVEGVSGVDVYGTPRAVRIRVDPEKLYARGLTFQDVARAIEQGSNLTSAGQIRGEELALTIVPNTQLDQAAQYGDLIVTYRDGAPVYLHELAEVIESVQNEDLLMKYTARGIPQEGVGVVLAVNKSTGANAVSVAEGIDELLPQLEDVMPPSVMMKVIYSRAETVINSVKDVQFTLSVAFILVVGIIFLFLGRIRDTIVPFVVMPMSLLMTFIAMRALNFNIDNLSLMALTLSIGFLVDDAIVFLENAVRRMQTYHESPLTAAINGAKEISFTIVATSVTLIAVFIPVLFMPGLLGRIFTEFGMTIIIVITMSTLLALTLTPMMCGQMLKAHEPDDTTFFERRAKALENFLLGIYGPALKLALGNRWLSVLVWIACIAGVGWFASLLPKTFLPEGDSGFMIGGALVKTGSSPEKVRDIQEALANTIESNPNVDQFVTVSNVPDFFNSNFIICFISVKDVEERIGQVPIQTVAGQLFGAGAMIPGAFSFFQPQPTLEISTTVDTKQGDYSFSIYGLDEQEVFGSAMQLFGILSSTPELFRDANPDLFLDNPELHLDLKRDLGSTLGVDAQDFAGLLQQAYAQDYSYLIKANNQQYQVIVEAAPEFRSEPGNFSNIFYNGIAPPEEGSLLTNALVPFESVADYNTVTGPLNINHIDNFSSVTLSFNLAPGASIGEATAFIEKTVDEMLPPSLTVEFRGEALIFQEAVDGGTTLLIVAIFIMYIVLGMLYESYAHPITVMAALPVALVGALGTLLLFGQELSLYAGIGLFMLLGIVQKNGIILIDFALMYRDQGKSARESIYEASLARFRPILMTTVSTLFGILPIALGIGADGDARVPLGLAIVGGLVVSQLITLFITPSFYLIFDWVQENVLDHIALFKRGERMT